MKRNKNKKIKGFTFVEILTVIMILAIIVGVGLPAYLWTRKDTRIRKQQVAIERVAEAKLKYYNSVKTAAALVPIPEPQHIAPYIVLDPNAGSGSTVASTNAFFSNHPESLFKDTFPPDEVWYLNPGARGQKPFYERKTELE
jgi:prepilin-type N-terminal cleavage/methylation domain-containing protein